MSPSSSRNLGTLSLYLPQCITRVSQRSVHAFSICKTEFQAFWLPCLMLGYQHPVTESPWCHGGRKELDPALWLWEYHCSVCSPKNRHKVLNGNIGVLPVTLCCCQQYVFSQGSLSKHTIGPQWKSCWEMASKTVLSVRLVQLAGNKVPCSMGPLTRRTFLSQKKRR